MLSKKKMNSILEKFFRGCKKIKDQKELEEYKNKGRKLHKLPLRGNKHISGLEFRPKKWVSKYSDDVYVNHFDEHGNQQEFVKEYIITRTGQVYTLNNDGSKTDMVLDMGRFQLKLKEPDENGTKTIRPQQTFLLCTSYLANYDGWDVIMQNRCKGEYAEVDHVLQNNEPNVDIQCLDLVTHAENVNRSTLDPKYKETIMNRAKSQGKPFTITIKEDGKYDIVLEAISCNDGVTLLKDKGITIVRPTIRYYLNGKNKKEFKQNGKTVMFKHTAEFLEDQEDIHGEIWRTEKDWNLAKEIRKVFENKAKGPPKAISNFGRIKTNKDIKTYGIYISDAQHIYNDALVHRLVGFAFHDYIEKDPNRQVYTPENTIVRHINYHELKERGIDEKKYRTDKEGRRVLSNHIDTLEFGTPKDNSQDLSEDKIHKEQQIPMNEFRVTPLPLRKDLPKFNRTFHSVSEFLKFIKEKKIDIKFHHWGVDQALKGEYKSHKRYEFAYVKSQVETQ